MKHFTKYLVEDKGFKSFRKIDGKYVANTILDYSTMQPGGIDIRFIKDDIEIIWGLHEYKKPATLISPRPQILVVSEEKGIKNIITEQFDDAMNICLKREEPDLIYRAIFDRNIIFKY